eukprot:14769005-Ditylum_brightwellii.AAC.1
MSGPTQRRPITVATTDSSAASSSTKSNGSGNDDASAVRQRRRVRRRHRKEQSLTGQQVLQFALVGGVLVILTILTIYKMMTNSSTSLHHHDLLEENNSQHSESLLRAENNAEHGESPLGAENNPQHGASKQKGGGNKRGRKPAVARDPESYFPILNKGGVKTDYVVPDSLPNYGDKTQWYLQLREKYDALLSPDHERSSKFVQSLHKRNYKPLRPDDMSYDIYNCPDQPPPKYPQQWNILELLDHWNPDDPTPPPNSLIHQVRNDPDVVKTTERWNYPGYIGQLMSDVQHRTEYSPNNHFMYWVAPGVNNKHKKKGKIRGPTGKL